MKTFTLKLKDKAAFLNSLEKQNITVGTNNIKDDTLNSMFTISFANPQEAKMVEDILKQKPELDNTKITKSKLKEMVIHQLSLLGSVK